MNLTNKVAAITGAGSGIGQALAVQLAQADCELALADISEEGLKNTRGLLEPYSVVISERQLDVSDRHAVYQWADDVVKTHGRVNMIVNNAGVSLSGTVAALPIKDYEWIMGINFWGVIYGTKAFLPHLEASGEGHIVNISSVFGLTSQPLMSGYNAAKFAVRGFTESLRQDLELTNSCVSSTCVHPGGIKTNIAKSTRMSDSVKEVTGLDNLSTANEFEKAFITSPDTAAKQIIKAVRKNKRRALIGPDSHFYDYCARLAPSSYQWLFTAIVRWRKGKTQ